MLLAESVKRAVKRMLGGESGYEAAALHTLGIAAAVPVLVRP
ncbi:MAG: hypothetical protein ACXVII_25675 [Solirubrobacteraceae bacterium]